MPVGQRLPCAPGLYTGSPRLKTRTKALGAQDGPFARRHGCGQGRPAAPAPPPQEPPAPPARAVGFIYAGPRRRRALEETGKIWMNGRLVPFGSARVHVLTHALHYASAVFEGLRCYRTPRGPAVFRLGEHVRRLKRSAKMYSMEIPYTEEQVSSAILKTVRASGLDECYIRPLAYRGYGWMGLTPTKNPVDLAIACWRWTAGESRAGRGASGVRCKVSSWARIDSRAQPMKAKAASNYANAALARVEALENGYDEAIMLGPDGSVAEGGAENIFVVKDGAISTPPLSSGILEGITRDSVVQIVEADGGRVAESEVRREDLYVADEVFMTGTAAEVKAVASVDRTRVGSGRAGPVTRALRRAYMDAATGRDERFSEWLTPV